MGTSLKYKGTSMIYKGSSLKYKEASMKYWNLLEMLPLELMQVPH